MGTKVGPAENKKKEKIGGATFPVAETAKAKNY